MHARSVLPLLTAVAGLAVASLSGHAEGALRQGECEVVPAQECNGQPNPMQIPCQACDNGCGNQEEPIDCNSSTLGSASVEGLWTDLICEDPPLEPVPCHEETDPEDCVINCRSKYVSFLTNVSARYMACCCREPTPEEICQLVCESLQNDQPSAACIDAMSSDEEGLCDDVVAIVAGYYGGLDSEEAKAALCCILECLESCDNSCSKRSNCQDCESTPQAITADCPPIEGDCTAAAMEALQNFMNAREGCEDTPEEPIDEICDLVCSLLSQMGSEASCEDEIGSGGANCAEVRAGLIDSVKDRLGDAEFLQLTACVMAKCSDASCGFGGGGGGGGGNTTPPEDPPPTEPEQGDPEDSCNKGSDGNGTPSSQSRNPVDFAHGSKTESVMDLVVPLSGADYRLVRAYRSGDGASPGFSWVGANWTMSCFDYIEEDVVMGVRSPVMLYSLGSRYPLVSAGSDWMPSGPSTHAVSKNSREFDDKTYAVWRVRNPGGGVREFYRTKDGGEGFDVTPARLVGLLAYEEDAFGQARRYEYTDPSGPIRLNTISFFDGGDDRIGMLVFVWNPRGQLGQVALVRGHGAASFGTVVERVRYTYKYDDDSLSSALGLATDLVDVRHDELLDQEEGASGDSAWRTRITQYRYHAGGSAESGDADNDGYTGEHGPAHALKLVILPEQVEYYGELVGGAVSTIDEAGDDLLAMSDGASFGPGGAHKVVDLASKVIPNYEPSGARRVMSQYLRTNCGCGGGSLQGVRLSYTFEEFLAASTVERKQLIIEEEKRVDASTWATHRRFMHDLRPAVTDGAWLVENSVVATGPTGPYWVTHYVYDGSGRMIAKATPSAVTAYDEGDNSTPPHVLPEATVSASEGLVYGYVYNSDNRRTETRISKGMPIVSSVPDIASFDLLTKLTYGTGPRSHLVEKTERVRIASTTLPGSQDDIETTWFAYGFHDSGRDGLAWIKTEVERELTGENGPGTGTYATYELFDTFGRNTWSRSADNVLTNRVFDAVTGALVEVTRNAPDAGLPAGLEETSESTSGWGRYGTGSGQIQQSLTTTYTRDLLGRVTAVTGPDGVTRHTSRELRSWDERPNLKYYAEVTLPHIIDEGPTDPKFNGPAEIRWYNTSGDLIGSKEFELDAPEVSTYRTSYSLGAVLAKSARTHNVSGQLVNSKFWWDADQSGRVHTTGYEYDSLGRMIRTTTPTGTIYERQFDDLDRVTAELVGTLAGSGGNMLTVTEYFYDSAGTTTSGIGNGNVTVVVEHVDASATRMVKYTHDYRDRLVMVESPSEPHSLSEYDNLDRTIRRVIFKGSAPGTPTYASISAANRGLVERMFYSQRGLSYRSETAVDPTLTDVNLEFIPTSTWYDEIGRIVARHAPRSPATKVTFDALGRQAVVYTTDAEGDSAFSDVHDFGGHAAVVTSDAVLEQLEYRFLAPTTGDLRGKGQPDLVTRRQRPHDASSTGALSSGAVTTYTGLYYDGASRTEIVAEFGTNQTVDDVYSSGGSAPTITQGGAPSGSARASVHAYNTRGLIASVTDPKDQVTRFFYDDAGRRIATVENAFEVETPPTWNTTNSRWDITWGRTYVPEDEDRVTSFVYDGASNVIKRVAHLPSYAVSISEAVQETAYDFGVVAGGGADDSRLHSNDLLFRVRYPKEDTGSAATGSDPEYIVVYSHNRQGEIIGSRDQNMVRHTFVRDSLGRIGRNDADLTSATGVDDYVQSIVFGYDPFSRLQTVRSHASLGGSGAVRNAIEYEYDPLWQIAVVRQNPIGDVTGSGPEIAEIEYGYTYAGGADRFARLSSLAYPAGTGTRTTLAFDYASGPDNRLSRVSSVAWQGPGEGSPATKLGMSYLGLSMPVVVDYSAHDRRLSLALDPGVLSSASGEYPGLDRFGRVKHQVWHSSGSGVTLRQHIEYEYDAVSNPVERLHHVFGTGAPPDSNPDEEYGYDGLHRLTSALRGTGGTYSENARLSQRWTLDALGNWRQTKLQLDFTSGFTGPSETDDRMHNRANEITESSLATASAWSHDDAGNLTVQYLAEDSRRLLVYDAWNRLRQVSYQRYEDEAWDTAEARSCHGYYGLHQRAWTASDTDPGVDPDADRLEHFYYDASWRLLERRVQEGFTGGFEDPSFTTGGTRRREQYVWGLRYIDELAAWLVDTDDDGDFAESGEKLSYASTDRMFSVVELTGSTNERVRYKAYGRPKQPRGATDFNGDDVVNGADLSVLLSNFGDPVAPWTSGDANGDGLVNGSDLSVFFATEGQTTPLDRLSRHGNIVGYNGYLYDQATGMWLARFRWHDPATGRWVTRDPAEYVDGTNLYCYGGSSPVTFSDPSGLRKIDNAFNAFIHGSRGSILPEPLGHRWTYKAGNLYLLQLGFATDRRSFGQYNWALPGVPNARLASEVSIESKQIGRLNRSSSTSVTTGSGESTQYIRLLSADLSPAGPWVFSRSATASASQTVTVTDVNACESHVRVKASASYPFGGPRGSPTPSIDYDVTFKFKVAKQGTVTIELEGWHNRFPDYEAYLDRSMAYARMSQSTGPGLWNLGFATHSCNARVSVSADTPKGCCR